MDCPACSEPLIVLESEQVEIDHCVSCKGIWLDSGELELLLGDSGRKNELLSSFPLPLPVRPASPAGGQAGSPLPPGERVRGEGEKPRKCPICLKKMDKVLYEDVRLDRCRVGDGLWFDLGELERIVRIGNFGGSTKVLEWLKGVFQRTA
ncbi:MAG: zf-TFIIB domain-containing protein [Candidatus Omnitrophica bacterium]|nr:zf-TFIIB domain-containing protein [Candidatus Omnitrophota bacterium]